MVNTKKVMATMAVCKTLPVPKKTENKLPVQAEELKGSHGKGKGKTVVS